MTEKRRPWAKFYMADWRANKELRMCGFAARGLWMDMLTLMHEAEPYGHLIINGKAPTPKQLSGLLGGGESEVSALLAELEENGVFARTEGGVIVSRRMVRERERENRDRENGGLGGNPELVKSPEGGSTPETSGGLSKGVKAQKLDARGHSPEFSLAGGEGAREAKKSGKSAPDADFEAFWKAYPRTPNDAKDVALRAWAKSASERPDIETMLECVAGFRAYIEAENRKRRAGDELRICHSSTWLNQGRWKNYLEAAEAERAKAQSIEKRRREQIPAGGEWAAAAERFAAAHGWAQWDIAVQGARLIDGDPLEIEYDRAWSRDFAIEKGMFEKLRRAAGEHLRATVREQRRAA